MVTEVGLDMLDEFESLTDAYRRYLPQSHRFLARLAFRVSELQRPVLVELLVKATVWAY